MKIFEEIEYPYQFAGCTVYKERIVCNKCGQEVQQGIIPISVHWNKCIDGGETLKALYQLRDQKGEALTIEDVDEILPKKSIK